MAISMKNTAMPTCLLALLLVTSIALLPCHATGRNIGIDITPIGKYCTGEPTCTNPQPWAVNDCRTSCLALIGFAPEKSTCRSGMCCCFK